MSWQMMLAASAAQEMNASVPDPDPAADAAVEWDAALTGASLTLTNTNRDVTNTGANNIFELCTAAKPIRPSAGLVYWEVEVAALGASTNAMEIGILPEGSKGLMSSSSVGFIGSGMIGGASMRDGSANATLRRGADVSTSLANFRTAGARLMFALDAGAGKLWIGVNGVWQTGDAGTPNFTTGVPTIFIDAGSVFWPCVKPTDNGDTLRLHSIASHFSYLPPTGAKAYGSDLVNFQRHELPLYRTAFITGPTGTAFIDWQIETGAGFSSTMSVSTVNFGFDSTDLLSVYSPWTNGGSNLRAAARSATTAATMSGIYQDHTFDSRWGTLIDSGEAQLEMSAFLSKSGFYPAFTDKCKMCVEFYDVSDVIIGSKVIGPDLTCPDFAHELMTNYFDVPVGTRKIRPIWRIPKAAGDLNPRYMWSRHRAALVRKSPQVRVGSGGALFIIYTP